MKKHEIEVGKTYLGCGPRVKHCLSERLVESITDNRVRWRDIEGIRGQLGHCSLESFAYWAKTEIMGA